MARKMRIAFYADGEELQASFVREVAEISLGQAEVAVLPHGDRKVWPALVRDASVVVIAPTDSMIEASLVLGMAMAHERFVITDIDADDLPNVIRVDNLVDFASKAFETARGLATVGGRAMAVTEGFAILEPSGGLQRGAKLIRHKEKPLPWALVACSLFVTTNKDGLIEPDAVIKGYKASPILAFLGTDIEALLAAYADHIRATVVEADRADVAGMARA